MSRNYVLYNLCYIISLPITYFYCFTKMVGPFAVDTTPPDFNGVISVVLEGKYLIAYWEAGAFVDHGYPSSLSMGVAIGK